MNRIFDFLEKHKYGVLIAIAVYIGLFIYSQMQTYERMYLIPVWDERADIVMPEEIEIKPENIEVNPQQTQGEVKSISQNAQDQREKSYDNWNQNKVSKSVEQQVKDLEKQYYNEAGGEKKREKILQEAEKNKQAQSTTKTSSKTSNQSNGGEKAYAGNVMVEWVLSNRDPHQNNAWYVRNPGYTCGAGSAGLVSVKIKVDQTGKVIAATYDPSQSSSANACMIEQAKKYALMSRFNYSTSAPKIQDGVISYNFVSQ